MQTYILLLRGINVGGHAKVPMADLKKALEDIGLQQVQTYIQSGNVIFQSALSDRNKLHGLIEKQVQKKFFPTIKVLLLTPKDVERVLTHNPFIKKKGVPLDKLYVALLLEAPSAEKRATLVIPKTTDQFHIAGSEIYLYYVEGAGRTKLTNNFFEAKLGVTATTRNWNTLNKLLELSQ